MTMAPFLAKMPDGGVLTVRGKITPEHMHCKGDQSQNVMVSM